MAVCKYPCACKWVEIARTITVIQDNDNNNANISDMTTMGSNGRSKGDVKH